MSWRVIARQDGRLTAGARSVKLLLGVFALGVFLLAYLYPVQTQGPVTTARFTGYVTGWLTTIVPIVGILVGYNAVVSERESGALLLSLALPHRREDVLLGKFAGRTGPLAAAIVGTMAVAGALVVYPFGELALAAFVAFVALTVLFGAIWTGLGLAVSLAVATKRRALVLGFGLVFVFVFVWGAAESALRLWLAEGSGELPAAAQFVFGLAPGRAFARVTDGFLDPGAAVEGPWYLGEWAGLAVLLAWAVAPLGLAALRFARRDLA
jgi:ABC-type transport system involved in multi-copper enzyme maturation permease subunit